MKSFFFTIILGIFMGIGGAIAQSSDSATVQTSPGLSSLEPPKKKWYSIIGFRGYTQIRYNRFLETNEKLKCEQCDKSWGENGGIFIRRARLILSGNVHKRVYIYIQPDLASSASASGLHFAQLRDAYFDLALDRKNEFRIRLGQSKVPFGFENLQSSQNRLPLDRNDALNSALANERDKGIFFYWAPAKIKERFFYLVSSGLKGTGDYGVFGFGAYDGQTANVPDANNERHLVARLTYPFQLKNGQIFETSIQGYSGKYTVVKDKVTNTSVGIGDYIDRRAAASFVLYPQPFGIQTEYNIGEGPEFDPVSGTIKIQKLRGGYFQALYKIDFKNKMILIPFLRTQYYEGGKKHETDARRYLVTEHEIGVEWQPFLNFELVVMYTISDRRFEDLANLNNRQTGNLLRLQAQFNY